MKPIQQLRSGTFWTLQPHEVGDTFTAICDGEAVPAVVTNVKATPHPATYKQLNQHYVHWEEIQ